MKTSLTLLSVFIVSSAAAEASSEKAHLLLSKTKGGLDSDKGEPVHCEIYSDNDKIKDKAHDLAGKIEKLKKIPISVSLHIMATVPSLQYTAFLPNGKSIEVLSESSDRRERKGKIAEEIVSLIDSICEK